jgi:hypothetical protein
MHRRILWPLCLVLLTTTSCIVPEDGKPEVNLATTFATKFVHRGMTMVDNPVLQPRLAVGLPTVHGDRIGIVAEGNMDLRNDTGGAWFPDGHAGRFSQIEAVVSYTRSFGDITLQGGVHNYNLPNGLEFANGERGATSEVFLLASANVLEATPYLGLNYDFDEVRGGYYRAGVTEDFVLDENWQIVVDGSLGYVSEAQAAWLYGLGESGLADLRGTVALNWRCDPRTTLSASVNGSAMMNATLDRWFDQVAPQGVDDDPIWFTFAVRWVF